MIGRTAKMREPRAHVLMLLHNRQILLPDEPSHRRERYFAGFA
jgi:hypothetical protein